MLSVSNVEVLGLSRSIVASGYPMKAEGYTKEEYDKLVEEVKSYLKTGSTKSERVKRMVSVAKKLGHASPGSGHDSFLKGIVVQSDIKYPVYWTPQAQRYSFLDIISSQSSMHRITKMSMDKCFNEYVLEEMKDQIKEMINAYNKAVKEKKGYVYYWIEEDLPYRVFDTDTDDSRLCEGAKKVNLDDLFMMIISNCPQGLEKTMRISTNYLQLKTICKQRANHKLKDWRVFVEWCKTLPHFSELTGIGEGDINE